MSQPPLITSTIDDCTDDPSYTGTGEARPLPTGNGPDSDSIFGGKPSTITIYTPSPTTWIFGTVPVTTVRPTSLSAGSAGNDPTITFSGSSGNAPTAMISGSIGSTKTPVGPVTSRPASVTVAAAAKAGPAGAILAAGLALFAL